MEGFLKEVQRVWDAEWERVYGASKRGERMRSHHPKVQLVEYTGGKVALLLSDLCCGRHRISGCEIDSTATAGERRATARRPSSHLAFL